MCCVLCVLGVTLVGSCRSLFGGQRITVYGAGFGENASLVEVLLGDVPCNVEGVSGDFIECVTQSSAKTHHIDNFG